MSGAIAPDESHIPLPSPGAVVMFQNINRNSVPFLQAVGIGEGSKEHKELMVCYVSLRVHDVDLPAIRRRPSKRFIASTWIHSSTWKSKHQAV